MKPRVYRMPVFLDPNTFPGCYEWICRRPLPWFFNRPFSFSFNTWREAIDFALKSNVEIHKDWQAARLRDLETMGSKGNFSRPILPDN